jgi:hypothetical protein
MVDGHQVGAVSAQSGGDGNMVYVTSRRLARGRHSVALVRGGGGPAPGDNSGTSIDGVYLQPASDSVGTVPADHWRALCGRFLDWVEVA